MVVAVASPSSAPPAAASPSLAPAAAASPPSGPAAAARAHPTYKEMIVQALTELRQPGGSSRVAIARYVADCFSGLPASHDALLSAHLRRLESQGVLRTHGYSYVLSSSSSALLPRVGGKRRPGRPRKNAVPVPVASSSTQPTVKRGPGRPRKNAAPLDLFQVKRRPGRPRKNDASPGVKLGPGRPRRNSTPVTTAMPVLGEKRGRGRPPKSAPILTAAPGAKPNGKRRPGRPRKSVVIAGAAQGSSENAVVSAGVAGMSRGRGRPPKAKLPAHGGIAAPAMPSLVPGKRKSGRSPMEKRRPGRPRKDKPLRPVSVLSGDAALTKRGPGRPRKKRTLEVGPSEAGGAVATEMTEAWTVQNGGGARSLQSGGASSMQKRGRGRPRKEKRSETEPAEIVVAALLEMRECGRPRKEKPSAAWSAETGDAASVGNKRGRGRPRKDQGNERGRVRPRKDQSFETGFAEAAGQVSRDLTEARPRKDEDLVSGEKMQTEGVALGDRKETRTADAGCVLVSGENANAASAPVEAGDAIDSNLGSV